MRELAFLEGEFVERVVRLLPTNFGGGRDSSYGALYQMFGHGDSIFCLIVHVTPTE